MQENMECGGSSLREAHLYRAHVSNVLQEEHTDITMHTWYSAALASLCLTQILALSTQILKMKNEKWSQKKNLGLSVYRGIFNDPVEEFVCYNGQNEAQREEVTR